MPASSTIEPVSNYCCFFFVFWSGLSLSACAGLKLGLGLALTLGLALAVALALALGFCVGFLGLGTVQLLNANFLFVCRVLCFVFLLRVFSIN